MRPVSCILLLEWATNSQRLWVYRISVPYAQIERRFLFEKRRGQPREFWFLVSTIDGSTLPQECVEDLLCGTQRNKNKNKPKKGNKCGNRLNIVSCMVFFNYYHLEQTLFENVLVN